MNQNDQVVGGTASSGEFDGKVAIVTGGGTGIGLAAAQRLATDGAAVVLCSNDDISLDLAEYEMQTAGRRVVAFNADVSLRADVEALVAFAIESFGALDIVVNAAAIQPYGTVESMIESIWDAVIDVNLGLLERDAENGNLAADALEAGLLDELLGHSITYRIAVGPHAGRKVFT